MNPKKRRVLFLCTGNACRSQMAEGWARHLLSDTVEPHSAGTEPHGIDPRAVLVMSEAGVDISSHRSKHVREFEGGELDLVVTLCDAAAGACPVIPGAARVLHRGFDDPARAVGSDEEKLAEFRRVRDEIREFVRGLGKELAGG